LLADGAVVLYTVLDKLINTKVEHVVFDCEIRASRVHSKLLFVVNDDHSGAKTVSQILNRRFKRQVSLNWRGLESTI
jgi:hypothetical protein